MTFPRLVPGTFSVRDGRRVLERCRWVKPEGEMDVAEIDVPDVPTSARVNEAGAAAQRVLRPEPSRMWIPSYGWR